MGWLMVNYPQITENGEDGFSEWIKPRMKGYQMACCDCNLVHTLDFKIVRRGKVFKEYKDGNHSYEYHDFEGKTPYEVMLRAKRNKRATGQKRRKK